MKPLVNTSRMIHTQRQRHGASVWEAIPPVRQYDSPGWASVFLRGRPAMVTYGWVTGVPLLRSANGDVIANLAEGAVQLPGPSGAWRWRVV